MFYVFGPTFILLLPAILLFRLAASLISPFALQPLLFS